MYIKIMCEKKLKLLLFITQLIFVKLMNDRKRFKIGESIIIYRPSLPLYNIHGDFYKIIVK